MKLSRNAVWRYLVIILLAVLGLGASPAMAMVEKFSPLLQGGYTNCSKQEEGGSIKFRFSTAFKAASGHTSGWTFRSRGMALFGYNATGGQVLTRANSSIALNGVTQPVIESTGKNYVVHLATSSAPSAAWTNDQAYAVNVVITVPNQVFSEWPAIGVHLLNVVGGGDYGYVFESTGALYFGPQMEGCRIIDSTKPPPPSPVTTEIKVTAPDWDLGELERGKETTRNFVTDEQRLCFSYDAKYIEYDKYLISASNRNGVADNKFLLSNTADGSETVPYTLSLDGGGTPVALPSAKGLSLTLGKSGRTCLTPTFKAWAGAKLKGGDFSDVLTFTIVTQT